MICPSCGADGDDFVIDYRKLLMTGIVRRRRQCRYCNARFTTYEIHASKKLQKLVRSRERKGELNMLTEIENV